jgi:hypothetical protein
MKYKKKIPRKIKARAKELMKPLYARPDDMHKVKMTAALYADHQHMQRLAARKSEYDRLTGLIDKTNPGLRGPLLAERSKLL